MHGGPYWSFSTQGACTICVAYSMWRVVATYYGSNDRFQFNNMCGIIAAISSEEEVAPILLEGLKREEYRGYDSAGVAVLNGRGTITVRKDVGRVKELEERYNIARLGGKVGIAHTRWA